MNKLKLALIPAACLLAGSALNYLAAADSRNAARDFSALTASMFQNEIISNTLTLHYTLEDPESYGIDGYPITYGSTNDISLVTPGGPSVEEYRRMLYRIPYDQLSVRDQLTFDVLALSLENAAQSQRLALYQEPLGPTIGIQAQLPILLSEFALDDTQDIEEYLELLVQTDAYFSSLLQFEQKRSRAGLFMSDRNAQAVVRQCSFFIEGGASSNLLVTLFDQRIDALAFLDTQQKAQYKLRNLQAVEAHVIPAYELLISGLNALMGTGKNENGLAHFPSGKAYYEHLLRSSAGSYLPVEAIERRIRKQLSEDISACRELLKKDPSAASDAALADLNTDPVSILSQLQKKMLASFPKAPSVNLTVKYVHPSLEKFLSPAFYLTPPIDDLSDHVIYLNSSSDPSPLELYTTLAHEGYPGHLYQNITDGSRTDPVRSLFSFGGFTEGWATYVEMESFSFAAKEGDTKAANAAAYGRLNRSVMLGLSSLLDICIHYHGYTREDTSAFLQSLGFARTDSAGALFDAIVEAPVNYLKYYLGYLTFMDLRSYCQQNWPEKFEVKDFHRAVLSIGPCPFPVLERYLKGYYRSL